MEIVEVWPCMALGPRLSRYRDLAWFAAKYRHADFLTQASVDPAPSPPLSTDAEDAAAFARDLEAIGPTFIKLGQLLSTRADLLPPAYLDALRWSRLS